MWVEFIRVGGVHTGGDGLNLGYNPRVNGSLDTRYVATWQALIIIQYISGLLFEIPFPPLSELLEMTCRVANVLKSDGVKKGDRVAIYMPVSPLLVASMLACARIGAIHRYSPGLLYPSIWPCH